MRKMGQAKGIWEILDTFLSLEQPPNVLLTGPPGVGKTYIALTSGVNGKGVISTTLTEEMSMAEQRGHYIPHGQEFKWHDGPWIVAWRKGCRLVMNEIQRASGDVTSLALVVTDDVESAVLTLPTGETVRPSPGFHVIATMNGDARELDPALLDRFPARFVLDDVHPAALERLMPDLRSAARNTARADKVEKRVGIRTWLQFDRVRGLLGEEVASQGFFGQYAQEVVNALKLERAK